MKNVPVTTNTVYPLPRLTGYSCTVQLAATGGNITYKLQSHGTNTGWADLAFDDGSATKTLNAGGNAVIYVAQPVDLIGVYVTAATGSAKISADLISDGRVWDDFR